MDNSLTITSSNQVLSLLGRNNFREIRKEDVLKLFGMLQCMDDSTKKLVLENYGLYSHAVQEAIKEFCATTKKEIETNKKISEVNGQCALEAIKALSKLGENVNEKDAMTIANMIFDIQSQQNQISQKAIDNNRTANEGLGYIIAGTCLLGVGILVGCGVVKHPELLKLIRKD